MENQIQMNNNSKNQSIYNSENTNVHPNLKNFIFILFYFFLFAFIVILGMFLYQKQKLINRTTSNQSGTVSNLLVGWKTYYDPLNNYEFKYPPNWKIIAEVPNEFMYIEMFNNLEGQAGADWFNTVEGRDKWLSGKMFNKKTCRGPILQNKKDKNQLIAFDINKENNDENPCFSAGYYFEINKWKVSDRYLYPIVQDKTDNYLNVEWKGDYRMVKSISLNQGFKAMSALINRETYVLKGETDFNQILLTFKFIN
jgi:hypothetical protein